MEDLYTTQQILNPYEQKNRQKKSYLPPIFFVEEETAAVRFSARFTKEDHNEVFDNIASLEEYLLRLCEHSDTDLLPRAVVFHRDAISLAQARRLSYFFHSREALKDILLILVSPFQSKDRLDLEIIHYFDDIILENISPEDFFNKITFLEKFKQLSAQQAENEKRVPFLSKKKLNFLLKRTIDIVLSLLLILVLSPVMLLIALLIKLTSKGPVFYAAERSGSDYKIFKFIKFRSMVVDADKQLSQLQDQNQYGSEDKDQPVFFKVSNDPRTTPIGRFLRNTSLDELPQLFNVLKGDMSLVGNRPLPLYEAETLTTDRYVERFHAPAGITGLWQVKKRGQKEMSTEERIRLDIYYARKHSVWYDLKIMAATPKALTQKDNV